MPKKKSAGARRKMAKTLRVSSFSDLTGTGAQEHQNKSAWLLVVKGAEVDLGRHMLCDHPITVGRDPDIDLSLNDGSISREHCSIQRDPETGRYMLVDLGSTNGTTVNSTMVHDRVPLTEGDKIYLGESVLRFSFADEVDLQYHERLEEMVTVDPLTGLSSKRQYDALFATEAARARKDHATLTVIVMDMDGLKQINDTHGHEMGGFAIAEVAALMKKVFGSHGHVARFGGDEFVACLPGVPRERAMNLSHNLRARVVDHKFERQGIVVHPTVSIGVATYPDDVVDPTELFTLADRAMYKAKRRGRDRVATVGDTGPMEAAPDADTKPEPD